MQVPGGQGVFVFDPEPGKDKVSANTVVDDGVNGSVTVHASCSQPIEVGDVFGPYTIAELVKAIFKCGGGPIEQGLPLLATFGLLALLRRRR